MATQLSLLVILFLTFKCIASTTQAKPFVKSKQAILIDSTNNTILFEKNGTTKMIPSSMTKILTAYVVFQKIKSGEIDLNTICLVDNHAYQKEGTKMFLREGERITINKLLYGLIAQSANDAGVCLAWNLAGNEADFAKIMNETAHSIGANSLHFKDATGLSIKSHHCSAYDIAVIMNRIIYDFPKFYKKYFSIRKYSHNGVDQYNKFNPFLRNSSNGIDGGKTGRTDEGGGYGAVASAIKNGLRLIVVINGSGSVRQRVVDAQKLLSWGFRNFALNKVFSAGEKVIEETPVWLGAKNNIALTVKKDALHLLNKRKKDKLLVVAHYKRPLRAPLHKDIPVGKLVISYKGEEKPIQEYEIFPYENVPRAKLLARAWKFIHHSIKYSLAGDNYGSTQQVTNIKGKNAVS